MQLFLCIRLVLSLYSTPYVLNGLFNEGLQRKGLACHGTDSTVWMCLDRLAPVHQICNMGS